jgi:hypothetical protein
LACDENFGYFREISKKARDCQGIAILAKLGSTMRGKARERHQSAADIASASYAARLMKLSAIIGLSHEARFLRGLA